MSKLGDLDSYGQDQRRIAYAGSEVDGANVDYVSKYKETQNTLKCRYSDFQVPYNGKDNDDYVNGGGFCCDDSPRLRAGAIGNGNDNPEVFQYYYHSDHLGSTSLITDLDGNIVQHVEYVPFGEVFIEERNNKWNTPYLFNAKELDEETGLYYYGARYYDGRVSVWLGVDPMWEKYPNMSVYAYCANNPVKYIDPDGRFIFFSPGTSGEFKLQYFQARAFMKEKGTDGIMQQLENSFAIIWIKESNMIARFNSNTKTIEWDPKMGLITDNGKSLSPATILNHEADHALQEIEHPSLKNMDKNIKDTKYSNLEEKRVITGSEQETAKKHGEIKINEVTRTNHDGFFYETKGATTTEGKDEITLTIATKKSK